MALKTKVDWKYRRPYSANQHLPTSEEKQMRHEISSMRKNLIKKQKALERSKEFSADYGLLNELQNTRLREIKTPRQTWTVWNRLRQMELSNKTSVTGMRETQKREIESLHERGLTWINKGNIAEYGEFMEYVRENYSMKSIGSDTAVSFYYEHRELSSDEIRESFDQWISKS